MNQIYWRDTPRREEEEKKKEEQEEDTLEKRKIQNT